MTEIICAPTLDDALDALARRAASNEARGGENFIFCEDRLTLLAERAVLKRTGGTFHTEVSTFSRFLSDGRRTLSKQGSVMALSSIIAQSPELKCFRKGSAQAVYETIAQLAASRVDVGMLKASAEEQEAAGLLRLKLSDLAVLLEKYEAFLNERGLLDENGFLKLLPEKISSGALNGKHVFFFAFPSFTAQAREGVRAAIENAESVTGIFLSGEEELYTNEAKTAFVKIAEEYGEMKIIKTKNSLNADARIILEGIFSPEYLTDTKRNTKKIHAFTAEDEASEMNAVCALIKKHTSPPLRYKNASAFQMKNFMIRRTRPFERRKTRSRRKTLRYRDIAVLVDGNGSFSAVEKAFSAFRIPFFCDRKRPFSAHPFCGFVLSALDAAACGGLPDTVDALASSVYFGSADNYRNYLLKFGGYRGAYKTAIKEGDPVKDYDREELSAYREKMIAVLSLFPAKGTGGDYVRAVRALFSFVQGEWVTETLQSRFQGAEQAFLDVSPLEGVLTEIEEIAGGQTFTAREFGVLLGNGLSALEISMIPQYADAVFIGDMTESRLKRAKVLFCTGLTDALPRVQSDTAVITDGDIRKLSALSVTVEPAIAAVNARARESMALNLCAFEKALYLSRPLKVNDAETSASEALGDIDRLFNVRSLNDLFPYQCSEKMPAELELFALREDFEAGREYDKSKFDVLRALLMEKGQKPDAMLNDRKKGLVPSAGDLYFSREVSPTLLEAYFSCPYSGFALRGLRLREREERSILDTDTGTFIHAVLERAAARFETVKNEDECRAHTAEIAKTLLETPRFSLLCDTKAGQYTGERLIRESIEVAAAAYRQLIGSSFRISGIEGGVSLPELNIMGKADRIDEADGYVRVIDYKTGEIDDRAVSYYTGRKLQLQLYLLAASRDRKAAGAFYFPARDDFAKPDEEKFRMKGFFSKDDNVLSLMDPSMQSGGKSRFFEGGGRSEKGMSGEDFEQFLGYASLVSTQAEAEMKAGNIAPSPYENACSYCKCKGMCAFTGVPRKEGRVTPSEIATIVRRERGEQP